MLEIFQKKKDQVIPQHTPAEPNGTHCDAGADSVPDPEVEAACDEAAMQLLDQLLAGHNPDKVLEECNDNDLVNIEADVRDMDAGTAGFTTYMNEQPSADLLLPS